MYSLVDKGVLERIGKGVFKIGKTSTFIPVLDNKTKAIYNKVVPDFPFITVCVWNTSLLNEFALHISNKQFILVEIERETMESVFLSLQEKQKNVYLNPSADILEQYVSRSSNSIIIKPLISEAPIQKVDNIDTITIEKMLVDLYCDSDLFQFYQGREKSIVYKEAFSKYTINKSKLLRYASRRGKKKDIEKHINQIIGN